MDTKPTAKLMIRMKTSSLVMTLMTTTMAMARVAVQERRICCRRVVSSGGGRRLPWTTLMAEAQAGSCSWCGKRYHPPVSSLSHSLSLSPLSLLSQACLGKSIFP
jgi:hypothetical protein